MSQNMAITDNRYLMGIPVYKFSVSYSSEIENVVEFFDMGWKAAVKAEQLDRQGCEGIACQEWKKGEWIDVTEDTIQEGKDRIAKAGKRTVTPKEEEAIPTLSLESIKTIKGAATTLALLALIGKKQNIDEETKYQVGMELFNVFSAMGYTIDEIHQLTDVFGANVHGY